MGQPHCTVLTLYSRGVIWKMNYDLLTLETLTTKLRTSPPLPLLSLSSVALKEQKEKYERELALLKEQFAEDRLTGAPSPVPQAMLTPPPDEEEEEREWENHRNQEMLLQSFVRANRLVQEANMLSEELRRDTFFKVTLQIPPKYLRPKAMVSLCVEWSGVWCGVECGVV